MASGHIITTFTGGDVMNSNVDSVALSPDGKTLAVASGNDTQLWAVATRRTTATLTLFGVGRSCSPRARAQGAAAVRTRRSGRVHGFA